MKRSLFIILLGICVSSTILAQVSRQEVKPTTEEEARIIARIKALRFSIDSLMLQLSPETRDMLRRQLALPTGNITISVPVRRETTPEINTPQVFTPDPKYEALTQFDRNGDGKLGSGDDLFIDAFQIWHDKNRDKRVSTSERSGIQEYLKEIRLNDGTALIPDGTIISFWMVDYVIFDLNHDGTNDYETGTGTDDGILVIDTGTLNNRGYELLSPWGSKLEGVVPMESGQILVRPDGTRKTLLW